MHFKKQTSTHSRHPDSLPWVGGRPGCLASGLLAALVWSAWPTAWTRRWGYGGRRRPSLGAWRACGAWYRAMSSGLLVWLGDLARGSEAVRGTHAAVPYQASSPQDLRLFYERNKTLVPT